MKPDTSHFKFLAHDPERLRRLESRLRRTKTGRDLMKSVEATVKQCVLVMDGDHEATYERDYPEPVVERKALADLSRSGKWKSGDYETVLHDGTLTVYEK